MNLSNALCGDFGGTYHIFPHNRRTCHTKFLTTWYGVHHGFSDPAGKVYEQGKLIYYWEHSKPNFLTSLEDGEDNRSIESSGHDWQIFAPDTGEFREMEPAYCSSKAVYNWEQLSVDDSWKVTALDKVHNKGEIVYDLKMDAVRWTSFYFIENLRESKAVYYWSQTTTGTWQAIALGLSADIDPTYQVERERNRDKHRWGYYVVLPQLAIDKNFGLTLRCVR
jgi:hypothetical protein